MSAHLRRRARSQVRLLPGHFRPDGRAKRPMNRSFAQREAKRQGKRAYKCDFCPYWHIGGRA